MIYEDISGHGTSVAGIIAAKDNDEGITGINPYVQLYSARILDENKQAPASRVVAAIDWAIEQDVCTADNTDPAKCARRYNLLPRCD